MTINEELNKAEKMICHSVSLGSVIRALLIIIKVLRKIAQEK